MANPSVRVPRAGAPWKECLTCFTQGKLCSLCEKNACYAHSQSCYQCGKTYCRKCTFYYQETAHKSYWYCLKCAEQKAYLPCLPKPESGNICHHCGGADYGEKRVYASTGDDDFYYNKNPCYYCSTKPCECSLCGKKVQERDTYKCENHIGARTCEGCTRRFLRCDQVWGQTCVVCIPKCTDCKTKSQLPPSWIDANAKLGLKGHRCATCALRPTAPEISN